MSRRFGRPLRPRTQNTAAPPVVWLPPVLGRDRFLDGLRAVALIRVVLWHATGWAAWTWVLSAVPATFAVTGALWASAADRRAAADAPGWRSELTRARLRRLLIPFWCYVAVVVAVSVASNAALGSWWAFVIPVADPTSDVAGGWATTALWYVRALVWVLAAAPLLHVAARRLGPVAVVVAAAGVVVCELAGDSRAWWLAGDAFLYGGFALAGMVWLSGRRPSPTAAAVAAGAGAVCVGAWVAYRFPPGGVVNDDHVAHTLVGFTWIAAALAVPGLLRWVATTRPAKAINRHSLSVYLWHPLAAWAVWELGARQLGPVVGGIVAFAGCLILTAAAVAAFGWIEQAAAKPSSFAGVRDRIVRPGVSLALAGACVAAVVVGPGVLPDRDGGDRTAMPNAPSRAPAVHDIVVRDVAADEPIVDPDADPTTTVDRWPGRLAALDAVVADAAERTGNTWVRATVTTTDGHTWTGTSGDAPDAEPIELASVTKTFTAAVAHRLAGSGIVDLDAPVGDLGIRFGHPELTLRQLLTHSSGLAEYNTEDEFTSGVRKPADVVRWAGDRELTFEPGAARSYSSTNYMVIGLALEAATGQSWESMVADTATIPYGLDLDLWRSRPGHVGFATAGATAASADTLAVWARTYLLDRPFGAWAWDLDPVTAIGDGIIGYCPCGDPATTSQFSALGYAGQHVLIQADNSGTVVILEFSDDLFPAFDESQALAHELRTAAGGGTGVALDAISMPAA